jgi:hypothetical protein
MLGVVDAAISLSASSSDRRAALSGRLQKASGTQLIQELIDYGLQRRERMTLSDCSW